ncbi:MAG: GTPase HflX [Alphaproteobacteria bacterium]|nr:GTPase HflX [Alphaproteobacteria bacterium]
MLEQLTGQNKDTAIIIQPVKKHDKSKHSIKDLTEEAEGLAHAIYLDVLEVHVVTYDRIQSGSFFGKGKLEEIADRAETLSPDIVIVNASLSPVQQRNLEKKWNTKVIDRTGLILEIFGERAQTKEGRLQVDLAALEYQKSRLVRSWTHLERQRGGAGFMGGPGERQIELDRRIIGQKIKTIKKELQDVRRTRELGRKNRSRVPFPVCSFVGYTNAGKSTLFNHLTNAGVFAEDLPFATLDPTLRKITLPNKHDIILADTVGFISDLPTHLVEAFRATLEQITYSDVILHIIDVSSSDYEAQIEDVVSVLKSLGIEYETDPRIIEVYNKIDAVEDEDIRAEFLRLQNRKNSNIICISALKGQGIDLLLQKISENMTELYFEETIVIPQSKGKAQSWVYDHMEVLNREDQEDKVSFLVRTDKATKQKFDKLFA